MFYFFIRLLYIFVYCYFDLFLNGFIFLISMFIFCIIFFFVFIFICFAFICLNMVFVLLFLAFVFIFLYYFFFFHLSFIYFILLLLLFFWFFCLLFYILFIYLYMCIFFYFFLFLFIIFYVLLLLSKRMSLFFFTLHSSITYITHISRFEFLLSSVFRNWWFLCCFHLLHWIQLFSDCVKWFNRPSAAVVRNEVMLTCHCVSASSDKSEYVKVILNAMRRFYHSAGRVYDELLSLALLSRCHLHL